VVVDSDEDELQAELAEAADAEDEGAAGGETGGDADTPAAAAAAAAAGEGDGEGGEGAAAAAAGGGGDEGGSSGLGEQQGIPVEVGRDQMLLEFICEVRRGLQDCSISRHGRSGVSTASLPHPAVDGASLTSDRLVFQENGLAFELPTWLVIAMPQ
jgi:hypothetical protein